MWGNIFWRAMSTKFIRRFANFIYGEPIAPYAVFKSINGEKLAVLLLNLNSCAGEIVSSLPLHFL